MRALLISTYELGRQPYGLASPAAWLRRAGWDVVCADVTRERLQRASIEGADLVGFHLPMHTATRLAGPVIRKVREINPSARVCAYGLYAPLNGDWLRSIGVDAVFGGEFEEELTQYATRADGGSQAAQGAFAPAHSLPRARSRAGFRRRRRTPSLHMGDGRQKVVGSTEASRGCKHLCRHCPVVPIYRGQFRIVPPEVVLADVAAQVAGRGRTHHVRRSRFLQRSDARDARGGRAARGAPGRHLRRHDQGRAPAAPPRPAPPAGRERLRLRHERGRIDRRRRAADAGEGPHASGFRGRGRRVPRREPDIRPHVRRVPPVAHARRLLRSARSHRPSSTSSTMSRPSSWRFACSSPKGPGCSSWTTCGRVSGRSTRRRSRIPGCMPILAWTISIARSPSWSA